MKPDKKELEERIVAFMKQRVKKAQGLSPHSISIREIYLGVDAGSFGSAEVFNSVLSAMHKAMMIHLEAYWATLSPDLERAGRE